MSAGDERERAGLGAVDENDGNVFSAAGTSRWLVAFWPGAAEAVPALNFACAHSERQNGGVRYTKVRTGR